MKAFFFSPPKPLGEKDAYSTLEAYLVEHLRAEVVRLPRLRLDDDPKKYLDDARDNLRSATVLLLMAPSATLQVLGEYGAEFVDRVITRMQDGVPAIVSISGNDLPNGKILSQIAIENLEKLYRALEARPFNKRVSKSIKIEAENDYTYEVDQEDIQHPEYLGGDGQLFVNQAHLLNYDGGTYPLVLAQTNVEMIDDGDLPTKSVPGRKPAIVLYRKVNGNYQIISSGSIFADGFTSAFGVKFPGAKENEVFIKHVLDEIAKVAPTFENRANRAYQFFVRCERGIGILLNKIFNGQVAENLTSDVRAKLEKDYKGDLGRLTMLEMLEAIRSRSRWPKFESGMTYGSKDRAYSRKEFSDLVDSVNSGARNVLAHPAKSVFNEEVTITDLDIENLSALDAVIWNARVYYECSGVELRN